MQVRLLGPVDVVTAGVARPVGGLRPRAVLAVLGLTPGEVVSTDRLIDVVWGGQPPQTALNTLQRHVSHLRGLLGDRDAIVARPPGYVLNLGAEGTDLQVATRLIERAGRAGDPAGTLGLLRSALDLWRGRPLADLDGLSWLDGQAERLSAIRLDAVRAVLEARLALGEHANVVPELQDLVRQQPYDERLAGQLMVALYRSGRPADALAAYQRLRRAMADELGIDPGAALRDLEAAILRQDPTLDAPARPSAGAGASGAASGAAGPAAPAGPVPRQLPADMAGFTGRTEYLSRLDDFLDAADERPTMVIAAVSGTAGVGKTTLAVHWAHRVAERFPDGQLYVNLRGFDATGSPMDPAEAVRGFLDAFAVPAAQIPASFQAQTALYRSLLAGRRMLVVLDNARDVEQVRPLLPGSSSCMVVVTSRNVLPGLIAGDGANPLPLDLVSVDEAAELLEHRLGKRRVFAEPDAVDAIIAGCARLPLALAVVAARAALRVNLPLHTLADELRDSAGALHALDGGDATADVRAVLSWSYRQLSADAARLFRLLGLHPGPDVTAAAAASLAALPVARTRPLLAELARASLVVEAHAGRYALHDLLRAYAVELLDDATDGGERPAATVRLLDHYLHTAYAADRLLEPSRDPIELVGPAYGVTVEDLPDHVRALAWFDAEHAVLLAVLGLAAGAGYDAHNWQLPWALANFLSRRGRWHEYGATQQVALAAARRLGEPSIEARAHRNLASAYTWQSRFDDAHTELRRAIDLCVDIGDRAGQAHALYNLAHIGERRGRPAEALDYIEQALDLYRAAGNRQGQAYALNAKGWLHAQLDSHGQALAACEEALVLLVEIGDRDGQAATIDSIGFAHHNLGDHARAVERYEQAVALYRANGNTYEMGVTLVRIGDTHLLTGDRAAARRSWLDGLAVLEGLDHSGAEAEQTRAKLADLDPPHVRT